MSQVVAMAGRLQDAENTINELRAALEQATQNQEQNGLRQTVQYDSQSSHISSPSSATIRFQDFQNTGTDTMTHIKTDADLAIQEESLSDLSLDEHGKVR
jgi:phage shock protein A